MTERRKKWLAVILLSSVAVFVVDTWLDIQAMGGCWSEGQYYNQRALWAYAVENGDQVPTKEKLITWSRENPGKPVDLDSSCGTYRWGGWTGKVRAQPDRMISWCSRPHGLLPIYRNVLFNDLSFWEIPEWEFWRLRREKVQVPRRGSKRRLRETYQQYKNRQQEDVS